MNIAKHFNPAEIEDKWYKVWEANKLFHSEPNDQKPYTIVIPPPNVTGVLHMGHVLNNTIQDVLVRRARMQGKNACWVPGTDHASIATEAKVVEMLKEQGIEKNSISREEFLEYAWQWKEEYGGIILKQLKRIGASCDWERTRFTMEDALYKSVIKVFVDLHNKGYIYKGQQMVNWDPVAQTAISDEEVDYKEVTSELYYIQYLIQDSDETLTVATTRPETILGDSAICVNPSDERYQHLIGKNAIVPVVDRSVPIIQDEYVDQEFGTGALKITPAHDPNDHELGIKHSLETIDVLDDEAKLNERAKFFVGADRFSGRKQMLDALNKLKQFVKTEEINNKIGYSERTNSIIEPKLSNQWFCRMKEMARPALQNVMNDEIHFFPEKFKNMYRHWMENIKDWCVSRQLWWGQRIPAYYLPNGNYVVAETPEEALEKAKEQSGKSSLTMDDLLQDEDVVDTWFSSWLWPITVFDGILNPNNKEINYYYPTDVLVTAPDIIFFWVARMIMAGYEYREAKPFQKVYFTGTVRDKYGRKFSKSLGNSPDIFRLMDDYGADGVRFGVLFSAPAGNDMLFDEKLCNQGRNFANKIWNALKLVKSWEANDKIGKVNDASTQNRYNQSIWLFENKFQATMHQIEKAYEDFRISEIVTHIYRLFWDDFCSRYLEWVKPEEDESIDEATYEKTLGFFENLLKLLHPYMPFITEEVWHQLRPRKEADCIMIADYPKKGDYRNEKLKDFDKIIDVNSTIRNFKSEHELSQKEPVSLFVKPNWQVFYDNYGAIIQKAAEIDKLSIVNEFEDNSNIHVIANDEIQIQHEDSRDDITSQIQKTKEELDYTKGFLDSVMKKLSNHGFINNAKPEVVEKEKQKKRDAEEKIRKLEENLKRLGNNN